MCQRGTSCQGHGCFVKRAVERRGKDLKRAAKIHQESGLLTPVVYTSSTPEVTFSREEGSRCPAALERVALVPRAERGQRISLPFNRWEERCGRASSSTHVALRLRPPGRLTGSGCYLSAAVFVTARSGLATLPSRWLWRQRPHSSGLAAAPLRPDLPGDQVRGRSGDVMVPEAGPWLPLPRCPRRGTGQQGLHTCVRGGGLRAGPAGG